MSQPKESSKAVRHLPLSSQLEYHRLIKRMKLLEKQREHKSQADPQPSNVDQAPSVPIQADPEITNITVTLSNDRFVQCNAAGDTTNESIKIAVTEATMESPKTGAVQSTGTTNSEIREESRVTIAPTIATVSRTVQSEPVQVTGAAVSTVVLPASQTKLVVQLVPAASKPVTAASLTSPEGNMKSKAVVLDNFVTKYHSQR